MFTKVREAIENAIDNGFDPLAMKAQDLAADLLEKAGDFADDTIEDVTDAVKRVKAQLGVNEEEDK